MRTETYILTHNSPRRLTTCLSRLLMADQDFFSSPVTVVDQSTEKTAAQQTQIIANGYGAAYIKNENLGASGGRWFCAQLHHKTAADAMFYFEDDIVFNDGWSTPRNGIKLPIRVHKPVTTAIAAVQHCNLSFLKLTFHEFWGAHNVDRSDNDVRALYTIEDICDQMFFVGAVYYSNWPMLITKQASMRIFDGTPVSEGDYRTKVGELVRASVLKAGVFAAEPLVHTGVDDTRPDDVDLRQPALSVTAP
jgi:hypothetical protein